MFLHHYLRGIGHLYLGVQLSKAVTTNVFSHMELRLLGGDMMVRSTESKPEADPEALSVRAGLSIHILRDAVAGGLVAGQIQVRSVLVGIDYQIHPCRADETDLVCARIGGFRRIRADLPRGTMLEADYSSLVHRVASCDGSAMLFGARVASLSTVVRLVGVCRSG